MKKQPKMFVDGVDRFDVNQGMIRNGWFLAALTNLAEDPEALMKVIPKNQGFSQDETSGRTYFGMFKFRFYRFGEWFEVVIDDRLPTKNGELIYMKAGDDGEFWSPLLEKAYAKFHGSYTAIEQ